MPNKSGATKKKKRKEKRQKLAATDLTPKCDLGGWKDDEADTSSPDNREDCSDDPNEKRTLTVLEEVKDLNPDITTLGTEEVVVEGLVADTSSPDNREDYSDDPNEKRTALTVLEESKDISPEITTLGREGIIVEGLEAAPSLPDHTEICSEDTSEKTGFTVLTEKVEYKTAKDTLTSELPSPKITPLGTEGLFVQAGLEADTSSPDNREDCSDDPNEKRTLTFLEEVKDNINPEITTLGTEEVVVEDLYSDSDNATQERAEERNLICIARLLLTVGLHSLRSFFRSIHPNWQNQPSDASALKKGAFKLQNHDEHAVYYSGDIETWDISLLIRVLQYTAVSSAKLKLDPVKGDALRNIQNIRNKLYSHVSSERIKDVDFNHYWGVLKNDLKEIGAIDEDIDATLTG